MPKRRWQILSSAIDSERIEDGEVKTADLNDAAVTNAKIQKAFGTETSVSVEAGGTSTISAGIYQVSLAANTAVQYSPDGGVTWRTMLAAGTGGVVISDGSNVRLYNAGAAAETSYLWPLS